MRQSRSSRWMGIVVLLLMVGLLCSGCAMGTPSQISQKQFQTDAEGDVGVPPEVLLTIALSGLPANLTALTVQIETMRLFTQELTTGQQARDTSAEGSAEVPVSVK